VVRSIIHVHQQEVRRNDPENHPAIIVRTYKGTVHCKEVEILGPSKVVHSPTADFCGARCWVETNAQVRIIS
jgi:hypothetical protein